MTPWGPIIAAMIAGFIAFTGMIITKESKVSEFRQAWINDFREEVSLLIEAYKQWAYTNVNYENHKKTSDFENSDLAKSHREMLEWYNQALHKSEGEVERYKGRIKLRLNSDINRRSTEEKKIDELLEKITKTTELNSVETLSDEIYLYSSLILSTEWKVVKKGEESYIKAKKFILLAAMLIGLIASISLCFHLQETLIWLMNKPMPLIIN
ncbi:hypothetical protein CG428_02210 [Pantoea ananatis]|uniref:hypothetical protein n=1 Tax=Pantoea ananas TaxID=553 RepID=UPI000CF41BE8|nr:hypothetical protein [Pantoea ananatis]PQK80194.1 hypothetical protein CG428_02210 [Pantoea ananatis]